MEKKILAYYNECVEAMEKAEADHDANPKDRDKKEIYQYCFAQVAAIEELMDILDIDYDDGLD